jgi:MFS transporter, AAHS family, 4-hydroxybenzoate transporter
MPRTVDVAALLDDGSWSRYQKALTVLAAFAIIFDGFDIQILGFAIPSLMREWHAARADFGLVLAVGLAGMAVGGPVTGYCGDRWGRRVSLIVCIAIFGLATVVTAFVRGFAGLTVLRFLTGMGTGGALPVSSAFAAEFAPLRWRPTAVKLTLVCVPLGGMLGGVLAAKVLPEFGWRGLYAIGGALPIAFAILLWAALPESPRFLARRPAEWPRLAMLLRRIGHDIPADAVFEDRAERGIARRASLRSLFDAGLARDTTGLWIACFFCLGSIYLVFGWLPAMLAARGLDVATASAGLAAYNFGGVFGVLLWAALLTILGSRGPLLSGALACAGSAVALLLVPIQAQGGHVLLIAGLALNGLLANAVQTSIYALSAHVYPTSIRATGVAYVGTIGRTGGLLSSLFGAAIIQSGGGRFWWVLAAAMVAAFAGLAWVRSHYPAMGKIEGRDTIRECARSSSSPSA